MSATHVKWLRDVFLWSAIEPSPGRFTFAYYDRYVLLAARRGLHLMAQLLGTPRWAGHSALSVPRDPSTYAQYVAAVVRRYGPNGTFWRAHPRLAPSAIYVYELWNEPYIASGNGGDYDPARYARLVKAAAAAGHAADPTAKFLLEADMTGKFQRGWVWWVDALYRAVPDLDDYFDGVSVHDYGTDTRSLAPMIAGRPYPNYDRILRIEDLRRQFVARGAGAKPFWITETGWSTCTEAGAACVTPAQQAADLRTLFRDASTRWRAWVHAVFIYRFDDGSDPGSVQGGYGLISADGTPKPALSEFRALAGGSPG